MGGKSAPRLPVDGRTKHGAFSKRMRRRYTDRRTKEGRHLQRVLDRLIEDIGPDLSAGQYLILDRIREKLIVLMQIGAYVDKQKSVITHKGALLPCLGKNYTTYAESLRRDLEALYKIVKRPKKMMTYEEKVRQMMEGKGDDEK
jgi:hypothetical protein